MTTKPLGRPIVGNAERERRRKYFADRYQRLKAEGKANVRKNFNPYAGKKRPEPHKVEIKMLALAEHMSRRPYHPSSVTWLDLSAGRSNS